MKKFYFICATQHSAVNRNHSKASVLGVFFYPGFWTKNFCNVVKLWSKIRFLPFYDIYAIFSKNGKIPKPKCIKGFRICFTSALEGTRTPDLLVRRIFDSVKIRVFMVPRDKMSGVKKCRNLNKVKRCKGSGKKWVVNEWSICPNGHTLFF